MKFVHGDIHKFKDAIHGKRLVCFGAGRALRNFIEEYAEYNLERNIFCIADNRSEYLADRIKIQNADIPVIGVKQLLEMKDMILLISCRAVYDVYMQLNSYKELENTECWASGFIRSDTNMLLEQQRWYPADFRITKEQMIPKKIHYCWFGRNPVPKKNREWMESWKKYCPDYEIIRWDEDNYDITKNEYMYHAYKAGKWGFVSDYVRLDAVYDYGGVYLDTDVELIRNLDDLLYQKAFAGVDASHNIALGLGFGAQQGCTIIRELKSLYDEEKFLYEDSSYNLYAAPNIQRPFFQKKGYKNNGDYQIIGDMTIYPEKVLSGKCNGTGRILPTKHTHAIHHYDGSWAPGEIKRQIYNNNRLFQEILMQ